MIRARQSTIEMPLTVVDHIADIQSCTTVEEIRDFGDQLPVEVRQDDRFTRAVARRLAELHAKKAAAPRDPMLLRRLGGDLWLVVAHWDLTEVERAAMATRVNG